VWSARSASGLQCGPLAPRAVFSMVRSLRERFEFLRCGPFGSDRSPKNRSRSERTTLKNDGTPPGGWRGARGDEFLTGVRTCRGGQVGERGESLARRPASGGQDRPPSSEPRSRGDRPCPGGEDSACHDRGSVPGRLVMSQPVMEGVKAAPVPNRRPLPAKKTVAVPKPGFHRRLKSENVGRWRSNRVELGPFGRCNSYSPL
jgi:hypothetical protein